MADFARAAKATLKHLSINVPGYQASRRIDELLAMKLDTLHVYWQCAAAETQMWEEDPEIHMSALKLGHRDSRLK